MLLQAIPAGLCDAFTPRPILPQPDERPESQRSEESGARSGANRRSDLSTPFASGIGTRTGGRCPKDDSGGDCQAGIVNRWLNRPEGLR